MSSKTMSVSNPAFDDLAVLPGNRESVSISTRSPLSKVSKKMLLGFGCVVAGAAFALGYFAAGGAQATATPAGAGDPDAALEASLDDLVSHHHGLESLNASDIAQIVEDYLAAPEDFEDEFIPKEFASLMSQAALEEGFEPSGRLRRLGVSSSSRMDTYRNLADASTLAKAAFQRIESNNYPDPVTTRDDVATVYKEGNRCWIVAKETDSLEDWINNIDLGKEDVRSINKYTQRNKACGCEKKRLWWCRRWKECPVHKVVGRSFDGFGKAYNEMRGGIYSRIQSKCGGVSDYVFAGYSRGGGIVSIGAFALWKEGLIPANKIKLVTFGSPRSLTSGSSDEVHDKFLVERHVYKNDPVPTLPANWWGYKHYGKHICQGCRKLGRNRPYVTNLFAIGDHLNYDNWL